MINHTVTGSYSDEKSKLSIIYISKYARHLQYGFNSWYTEFLWCQFEWQNGKSLLCGDLLAISKTWPKVPRLNKKNYKNYFLLFFWNLFLVKTQTLLPFQVTLCWQLLLACNYLVHRVLVTLLTLTLSNRKVQLSELFRVFSALNWAAISDASTISYTCLYSAKLSLVQQWAHGPSAGTSALLSGHLRQMTATYQIFPNVQVLPHSLKAKFSLPPYYYFLLQLNDFIIFCLVVD